MGMPMADSLLLLWAIAVDSACHAIRRHLQFGPTCVVVVHTWLACLSKSPGVPTCAALIALQDDYPSPYHHSPAAILVV